jgi:hypothetical protein
MPGGVAACFLGRSMVRSMRSWFAPRTPTAFFCAHALPKRLHKIDDVRELSHGFPASPKSLLRAVDVRLATEFPAYKTETVR